MPPSRKPQWAPDPKQRELIKGFGAIGLNQKQMGVLFGVSETAIKRAFKKDSSLRDLLEEGKVNASANVRNTAYKMANSGRNPSMTIFWLKTREGWCETVKLAGHDGGPIKTTNLTPEQMKEEIERLTHANKICDDEEG
jgi:hypothetical protein